MIDWPLSNPSSAPAWFGEVLRQCTRSLANASGWPLSHAWARDSTGEHLVSSGIWHPELGAEFLPWRQALASATFKPGVGLPGKVWQARAALATTDTCDALPALDSELAPRRAVAFPVICADEVVAVMGLFHRDPGADDRPVIALASYLGQLLSQFAEQAQRATDCTRLTALVETSDDAIISLDAQGTILSWNAGAERLYGYTRSEALGESLALIVPDELRSSAPVLVGVLRDARRLEQHETVRRRKNGQLVDVALTASPLLDDSGRVTGASSIERDISRRKRVESERLRALASAESANVAKSEFLANIGHELRTPMNAILGMLALSLDEELSPTLADYLGTAHESAQVLLYLLNDLLDFSGTDAGAFELEALPFRARKALDESMRTLSLRAHDKGLELACRIRSNVPDVLEGDARRFQQIVMNLCGNAIKFTESGGVIVEVSVAAEHDDAVDLLLVVVDTGIGISAIDQERIFAPFTQADASSTRKYSGTGLGLTIARELATRMNGRLWVESELGRGSCFCCMLRFKRAASQVVADDAEAGAAVAGKQVLVVDHNPSDRKLLEDLLTGCGLSPTLCGNAAEALSVLRAAEAVEFDVVLVDATMPQMDGYALLETAEREQLLRGAKIIMLDRGRPPRIDQKALHVDIAADLHKPISRIELGEAIAQVLGAAPGRRGPAKAVMPAGRALRILVAEDTRANQKVLKAILGRRGHAVEVVENGREALERLQKADFDVVVMDAQMPTMNGLQATAAIRRIPNADRASVPIIAMTAHAMREDRERCLASGMDDYLPKPVDAAELVRVVELHANRWLAERAAQAAATPR